MADREIVDARAYLPHYVVCEVRDGAGRKQNSIYSVILLENFLKNSPMEWLANIPKPELAAYAINEDRQSIDWPAVNRRITIPELEQHRGQSAAKIRGRRHGNELTREALVTRTDTKLSPNVWKDEMAWSVYDFAEVGTCRERRISKGGAIDWPDTFAWEYRAHSLIITQTLQTPMQVSPIVAEAFGRPGISQVTEHVHEFRPIVFGPRDIEFIRTTRCALHEIESACLWKMTRRPNGWR